MKAKLQHIVMLEARSMVKNAEFCRNLMYLPKKILQSELCISLLTIGVIRHKTDGKQ